MKNLSAVTNDKDVATKEYVDNALSNVSVGTPSSSQTPTSSIDGKVMLIGNGVKVSVSLEPHEVEEKDVIFIDYDGTILYSYTASEFAELTALPPNPFHSGLTAQGWNWSLSDAKSFVSSYGKIVIGQLYITSDGKTRIYITLTDRLDPLLRLKVNGTVDVDWGDESTHGTLTASNNNYVSLQHNYASSGNYVISLSVTGTIAFDYSSDILGPVITRNSEATNVDLCRPYASTIYKIEIGSDVKIGINAFRYCKALQSITIPTSAIILLGSNMGNAFGECGSLRAIVIPDGLDISGASTLFGTCYSMKYASTPKTFTNASTSVFNACHGMRLTNIIPSHTTSAAYNCRSLLHVSVLDTETTIAASFCSNCHALGSIIIPASVTSIKASAFASCFGLKHIYFKGSTPPDVANSNAWTSLPTDCVIHVPNGKLSAYTGKTNYPSSSTYSYVEEAA